jgi:hypothetical protein
LKHARVLLGVMRRFPAYTLSALLAEDTELLRLLEIEELGTPSN